MLTVTACVSRKDVNALPRSESVTRRVLAADISPALRSNSDRVPTDDASASFCASATSTSNVTALTTEGLNDSEFGRLIDGEHARVLDDDIVARVLLVDLARQYDVDVIAG